MRKPIWDWAEFKEAERKAQQSIERRSGKLPQPGEGFETNHSAFFERIDSKPKPKKD